MKLHVGERLEGAGPAQQPGGYVVTSVVRETIIYLRRHLVFELWEAAGPGAGLVVPRAGARGPEEGVAREPGADPPGADAAPEPENGVSEPEYPVPSRVDPR